MIWQGQYNAILAVVLALGVVVAVLTQSVEVFFFVLGLVFLVRICTGFINLLFKAFLGRPLVYETKIMMTGQRGGAAD